MAAADTSRNDRKRAAIFFVIVSLALLVVALIRFSASSETGIEMNSEMGGEMGGEMAVEMDTDDEG